MKLCVSLYTFYSIILRMEKRLTTRLVCKSLILMAFLQFQVFANNHQQHPLRFNHFEDYDYGNPRTMTIDSFGFLWIGTQDGLLRFDGHKYINFTPENDVSGSISGINIRKLYLDSKEQLWIGTTKGLNKFNYISNSFTKVKLNDAEYVYDILETTDGELWIATKNGLHVLQSGGGSKVYNNFIAVDGSQVDLNYIRKIHQDSDGNLWFGTRGQGLLRLDLIDNTLMQHTFPVDKRELIISISDYTQDELLLSTYTDGIYIFNKGSNTVEKYDLDGIEPTIREAIKSKNNKHYIATEDHGILVVEESLSEVTRISENQIYDNRSLYSDNVWSLFEDKKNNIWVGSKNTISSASLNTHLIKNYFVDNTSNGLSYGNIYAITSNSKGELYFGNSGTGIDKVLTNGVIKNLPLNRITSNTDSTSANVSALLMLNDNLWVGSSDGLLFSSDEENFQQILISESNNNVISLYALNSEELLVGTTDGLFLHSIQDSGFQKIDTLGNEAIRDIHFEDGKLWVVSRNGLFELDAKYNLLRHHTADSELISTELNLQTQSSDLKMQNTNAMVYIDKNRIVITSSEAGLIIYDPESNSIVSRFDEASGLPTSIVYGGILDNQKNLWISTMKGLSRIDLDGAEVASFHVEDGIQSEEYNINSVYKDSLGRLYFGGSGGVTSFNPNRLSTLIRDLTPPKMIWSRFETVVGGQYVPGLPTDSLVEGSLDSDVKFKLSYDDMSQIEFSTNNILKSDWIRYQTRLSTNGSDAEWIEIRNDDRQLKISLLPPGTHRFDVRASFNGQIWSKPLSMQIDITPPPWLTWWAYLSYFIISSMILGYFLRLQYQKNQVKLRSQKLIKDSEERLKLALWGSRDELWDWNIVSGKIHRSNTWGILSFPKRETDESGQNSIFRNIHPKDLPSVRAALDDHRNGYTSHYEATYRIKDKEGNWIWILDRGKIVEHDAEGNPLRMSGTIRNISEIRDTQEQLDLIAKAFENTSDGVFILDNQFKYQAVNRAYEKITGYKFNDKKDKLFDIRNNNTTTKDILHKVRQALVLEGAWQGELEDTRANGESYTLELKLDAVRDRLDEITHFVGVFSDITYRKKAEQDLRRMANYDQLTGLPNRSLFQDRLKHAIDISDRNNKELILLFIDLDNFKIVNDSLGHSIGDRLLTKVAERILACVRSNDTVARLGGDEYTILLEQVEGSFVGTRVADKILDALSRPFRLQGHELVISCSIGIAMYPDDGADVETLLRNADTAMYSAKYQDKNNYQFFTDSMNKKANSRLEMEHELRKAIPAGDIKVVYQPKVDLKSGEIIGCEALARWHHAEMGFVSPQDFIALAEETGLIYGLGESVLHQSCQATANWKRNNSYRGRTAVNLSAIQFRQTGLIDSIETILTKYGLSGSDIELELTEGMLVTNPDSVNQIMSDLRAKGYHLSIDDFGTGYASMAQLKKFPINTLKIDKTFIDDLTNDEQDASLVRAILSLAHNLNLATVAEGVEYEEQVRVLSDMGCDNIQGYVYSKPISEEDFATLLDKKLTLNDIIKLNNEKIINFPA